MSSKNNNINKNIHSKQSLDMAARRAPPTEARLASAIQRSRLNLVVAMVAAAPHLVLLRNAVQGTTALHRAVSVKRKSEAGERRVSEIAAVLLDAGADPNACNAMLLTPMHFASFHGRLSLVRLLLQHGAVSSLAIASGRQAALALGGARGTPQEVALHAGHARLADILPRLGAQAVATRENEPCLVALVLALQRRGLYGGALPRGVWAFLRGNL